MPDRIAYKCGYKYQLVEQYVLFTDIEIPEKIETPYATMHEIGVLYIEAGYAWDGPSGPTFDTPDSMRGSLVHDVLFQFMREGLLDFRKFRALADALIRKICIEDGMHPIRAAAWYRALVRFGESSADPKNDKKVMYAPA